MVKLSKNFKRDEFGCKCKYEGCVNIAVDSELVDVLQDVRDYFEKGVTINRSYSCPKHNYAVGGAERSKHLLGIAADIVVKGVDALEVYDYLDSKYPGKYGIGKYLTFTHIDVREERARW